MNINKDYEAFNVWYYEHQTDLGYSEMWQSWRAAKEFYSKTISAVSQWICVEDELPPKGEMVLATNCEIVTIIQVINLDNVKQLVTHWMPLPLAPKEKSMIEAAQEQDQ